MMMPHPSIPQIFFRFDLDMRKQRESYRGVGFQYARLWRSLLSLAFFLSDQYPSTDKKHILEPYIFQELVCINLWVGEEAYEVDTDALRKSGFHNPPFSSGCRKLILLTTDH